MSDVSSISNQSGQEPYSIKPKMHLAPLSLGFLVVGGICLAIGVTTLIANLVLPGGLLLAMGIAGSALPLTNASILLTVFGALLTTLGMIHSFPADKHYQSRQKLYNKINPMISSIESVSPFYYRALPLNTDQRAEENAKAALHFDAYQRAEKNAKETLHDYIYPNDKFNKSRAWEIELFLRSHSTNPSDFSDNSYDKISLIKKIF